MRCDVRNMLRLAASYLKPGHRDYAYSLDELSRHLAELGERHTAGDTKAIEEFLDLYCLRPVSIEEGKK